MKRDPKNLAILGSTGSIGKNTLDVVAALSDQFRVIGLTAHSQIQLLLEQAAAFSPAWIYASGLPGSEAARPTLPAGCQLLATQQELEDRLCDEQVDLVVSAIAGFAGMRATWSALGAGKTIALANKETLVVGGAAAIERARASGATLLPVDSEHNALFQCVAGSCREQIEQIILTASGGPFRETPLNELPNVTVAQALNHPTWDMGRRITIDSATMLNKALEVIEARWLFDISPDRIRVVIHPESIVHSLVEFRDGSVIAQLSPPDMRLPIQYALTYPERMAGPAQRMDWQQSQQFNFLPPDPKRYPGLELGFWVAERGGTSGAVFNAAKEVAVDAFLAGNLPFTDIVRACQVILDRHTLKTDPTFEDLIAADAWARQEFTQWNPN